MRLALLGLAPVFVVVAVLLGGASNAGVYANAALHCTAALIIAGFLLFPRRKPEGGERWLLAILIAALVLAIAQLVPLPPVIWTHLPGRQIVVETYALAGIAPGWRPLTLSRNGTIGAALALLPIIAAALIGLRVPRRGMIAAFVAIVLVASMAALLGLAQRATGQESSFYIYDYTNRGYAVGFFANSNHFATLCALALPATAAALAAAASRIRSKVRWLLLLAVIALAAFGIAFSGSLAGIGLAAIGLLASYVIMRRRRTNRSMPRRTAMVIGVGATALAACAVFVLWEQTSSGAGAAGQEMGRTIFWARTARAIADTLPVGTGLGSFTQVYPHYENPMTVTGVFANHAHNDYLETVLNTGIAGIAMFAWFLIWFGRRSIAIWTSPTPDPFARAASVMIVMIGLHEIVDYPLRTAAIAVIFGLCCGVMARPKRADVPSDPLRRAGRHLSA